MTADKLPVHIVKHMPKMEGESMVKIHHVLKNGTKVDSIEGHMIKAKDFPVLYEIVIKINQKEQKHETV